MRATHTRGVAVTMPNSFEGALTDDHLGRYRLVAPIGQGGMGRIFLAATSGLGEFRKLLVVKELQQELATNEKFVEMFLAEAKLAARLNHPNIVQTVEAGEENGRYFLAMEYLDGQPYTELLKRVSVEPTVTLATRLHVLCEVLSALQYVHELCDFDGTPFEIVHRDITPHNVFLTYHGQVKLVDFGIAKAVDVESLTNAGVFKGKFSYASPEQVRGEIVDHRSDLFALGVMLWEAIALRRFSSGPATKSSVDRRLAGGEPRISEVVPSVEPALAEICDKALALDREQRFQSAAEFRAELQRYLLICGDDPPQALAPLLCAKFAAERTAMFKTLDAYSKRDERNQSVIRSLRAMSQPAGVNNGHGVHSANAGNAGDGVYDDRSTRVGNFARSNAANRTEDTDGRGLDWSGSLRGGRKNMYAWIAGAGVLIGAIAAFLISRSEPERAPHLTMPAPPTPAAPGLAPGVQTPAAQPSLSAATNAPSEPVAPPQVVQPFAAEPEAPARDSNLARTRDANLARPRADLEEESPAAASKRRPRADAAEDDATTSVRSNSQGRELDDGASADTTSTMNVARNPYRAPNSTGSASEPVIAGARSEGVPRSSGATPGQDLRTLPRRPQRQIDVQDPFR